MFRFMAGGVVMVALVMRASPAHAITICLDADDRQRIGVDCDGGALPFDAGLPVPPVPTSPGPAPPAPPPPSGSDAGAADAGETRDPSAPTPATTTAAAPAMVASSPTFTAGAPEADASCATTVRPRAPWSALALLGVVVLALRRRARQPG